MNTLWSLCGWTALFSQRDLSHHVGGVKVTRKCGASLKTSVMQGYEQMQHWIRSGLEEKEWLNGHGHLSPTPHLGQSASAQVRLLSQSNIAGLVPQVTRHHSLCTQYVCTNMSLKIHRDPRGVGTSFAKPANDHVACEHQCSLL